MLLKNTLDGFSLEGAGDEAERLARLVEDQRLRAMTSEQIAEEDAARIATLSHRYDLAETAPVLKQLPEGVRSYDKLPNTILIGGELIGDDSNVDMCIMLFDHGTISVNRVYKYSDGNKIELYGGPTRTGTDYTTYGASAPRDIEKTNEMLSAADAIVGTHFSRDKDTGSGEITGESKARLTELIKLAHKK